MSDYYEIETEGTSSTLKILVAIDEDFEFPDISSTEQLTLDLDQVPAINSVGIRIWIMWFEKNPQLKSIKFTHCRRIIVDQINMVKNFLPAQATVESFYVPYYSDETDESIDVLFTREVDFNNGEVNSPVVKDSAGNEMEVDIMPHRYFKFLKEE